MSAFFLQIVLTIIFLVAFLGIGRIVLKKTKLNFESIFEEVFFSIAIGIAASISLLSILSILGLVYKWSMLFIFIGLIGLKGLKVKKEECILFLVIFLLFIPTILLTLYPPTHWDDISYHLPIAQSILDNHKLILNPYIRYPVFPINGEFLFLLGLSIKPIAAQLMPWICLFTISIGCFSEVRKRGVKNKAFIAFFLLISNQLLIALATMSYIDLILTLFLFSSIYALLNYYENGEKKWLYLSAFLLGISVGTKYTSLIFCLILGVLLLLKRGSRIFLKYTLIVAILGLPWYVRNFYYTGNPVWPFMSTIFGQGGFWNSEDYIGQFADFENSGIEKSFLNFLSIPLYLNQSFEGVTFSINIFMWLGFLIALIYMPKKSREYYYIIIFFLYTFSWFFSINLPRYYVPIVPILVILSAQGYVYFFSQLSDKRIKNTLISTLVILCLFLSYGVVYKKVQEDGFPPSNLVEYETYLARKLPTYNATKIAADFSGKTYGLFNENMFFYGKGKVIGDWFGEARYSNVLSNINNPFLLHKKLVDIGVENILINKTRQEKDLASSLNESSLFIKIYEDNNSVLYKLK